MVRSDSNPPNDKWPVRNLGAIRKGCWAWDHGVGSPSWPKIVWWLIAAKEDGFTLIDVQTFWVHDETWSLLVTAMPESIGASS